MKRFLLIMMACVGCINAFGLSYSVFSSSNFDITKGFNNPEVKTGEGDILYVDGEGGDITMMNWSKYDQNLKFSDIINACNANGDIIKTLIIVNVRDINAQSFTNNHTSTASIATIRLANIKGTIRKEAFQHLVNVKDVWVDQDGAIACENGAFDQAITVGNTQVGNSIAELHITPYTEKYYSAYYAMNAATNTQSGLNTLLSKGNGWQNFAKKSFDANTTTIATTDVPYLGTYSSPLPALIPKDVNGIYIIKTFESASYTTGQKVNISGLIGNDYSKNNLDEVRFNNKEYYFLPENTGVLIYSEKKFEILTANSKNDYTKIYKGFLNNEFELSNLNGNVLQPLYNLFTVGPCDYDNNNNVTYRNFFLCKASNTTDPDKWLKSSENPYTDLATFLSIVRFFATFNVSYWTDIWNSIQGKYDYVDYWAFFRANPTVVTGLNKAYLHVPASQCKSDLFRYFVQDYSKVTSVLLNNHESSNNAKTLSLLYGFDFPNNDETEATGITEIDSESKGSDDYYYNINGVKTKTPGKGIYIHNGKKVVIK